MPDPRLKDVHADIRRRSGDVLLFVEDLELLFGSPGGGPLTMAGTLRSLLTNRETQLVSTGSADTFRRIMRDDTCLLSMFQEITVPPPTPKVAYDMLVALRDRYEAYHRVSITNGALAEAVRLADRYFHERRLPATAIDLIDEASAHLRIRQMARPPDPRNLDERIAQAGRDKESFIDAQDFERAGQLREEEKQSRARLRACWATHWPVGWAERPRRWTLRVATSMTTSAYRRRSRIVSTWKKSMATNPATWLRRKVRQLVSPHASAPCYRGTSTAPCDTDVPEV